MDTEPYRQGLDILLRPHAHVGPEGRVTSESLGDMTFKGIGEVFRADAFSD